MKINFSQLRWARLPNQWIFDEGLKNFPSGRRLGSSMAALKVLLAIFFHAENNSVEKSGPNQGSASLTYDELSDLTDLSRPMIARAIKLLQSVGILSVKKEGRGRKNRFFLQHYNKSDKWGKISVRRFFRHSTTSGSGALRDLSCRREVDLNALKLYFLFCAFRDIKKNYAMIGYEKISDYTDIPATKIRRAISVLIEYQLVRVSQEKETDQKRNLPNQYEILGI